MITINFDNLQGFEYISGDTIIDYGTHTVEIRLLDGYENIVVLPYIVLTDLDSVESTFNFNRVDESNIFRCSIYISYGTIDDYKNTAYCYGVANTEQPPAVKYDITKFYKMSEQNISQLAQTRFLYIGTSNYDFLDLGQFIISLVEYPFNIESDVNRENIILGVHNTGIKSIPIEQTKYHFELFNDFIYGKQKNSSDIDTTTIQLNLSFYGVYTLPNYCINHKIGISYDIDIIDRNTRINIYIDNVLFNVLMCKVGVNLPYILMTNKDYGVQNTDIDRNIFDFEPSISILYNHNIESFTKETFKHCKISDIDEGFFICDNIDLSNINITNSEKDMIRDLLYQGVFL